jgi:hypothetical protein
MPIEFPNRRLSEVESQTVGFDCHRCRRHTALEWRELRRHFREEQTLAEIALLVAIKGNSGNPCRQPDACQVAPREMPVTTWATLQDAYLGSWGLQLECTRTHNGLKTAKSCRGRFPIDVRTLYVAFRYDMPIDRLRLRCPGCLSHHVHLIWTVPPPEPPPLEEVVRLPDGRPIGLDDEAVAYNTERALRRG